MNAISSLSGELAAGRLPGPARVVGAHRAPSTRQIGLIIHDDGHPNIVGDDAGLDAAPVQLHPGFFRLTPGSAAATKTPTGCCASTSPEALTSAAKVPTS